MGKISLLDCTLRDGGYINDWRFGREAIDFILRKLDSSGLEMIEVGFLKNVDYDPDCTLFPSVQAMEPVLPPKNTRHSMYVGMIDMCDPIDIGSIPLHQEGSLDALRVIFKQGNLEEGYEYISKLMPLGYKILVQFVSTDTYSDEELINAVKRFDSLHPYAIYIVDTLGLLRKRELMRMVYILDNNMSKDVILGYHSHNNLQQARGNAEAIVESGLERDVLIDACVFGMGRGAGNLNEELFADYLNDFFSKNYKIEPMLEIIDRYLGDIYRERFWGYSLPYYLSAKNKVHPNYAKYYSEKQTLTEKSFNELLKTISEEDSHIFSRDRADKYYVKFMENLVDETESMEELKRALAGRKVLVIAPGENYRRQAERVEQCISQTDPVIISIGFIPQGFDPDMVFCSNPRRYEDICGRDARFLLTSNIKPKAEHALTFNYTTHISHRISQVDNAGVTLLRLLRSAGATSVLIAGMDGYGFHSSHNSFPDPRLGSDLEVQEFNRGAQLEIDELRKDMDIEFVTDSLYR